MPLLLISGVLASCIIPLKAQTDGQFTQYWAMPTLYNPAAVGSTDYLRIRATGKLQWVGIENAPQTIGATADSPFKPGNLRVGAGVVASAEKIGLFSNVFVGAQISYTKKLGKGLFSIGIMPAYFSSRFKATDIYIPEGNDYHRPGDEALPTQDLSGNAFDLSAGLRWSHPLVSVGLSAQHIMSPTVALSLADTEASESHEFETKLPAQFYFTADGNIPLKNSLITLQPSMLLGTDLSSFRSDITLRGTYNRMFTLGLAYRWPSAICAMAGLEIKNFFLGYAYDYPLSALGGASGGSHELVVGYSLKLDFKGKNKNKHRSIRIM